MGRASRLKRERRQRVAARARGIPPPTERAKMLIRHRRSGALYEVISGWITRPAHCGVRRVLDAVEVVKGATPIEMFVTDPARWDWSPQQ